MTAPSIHCPSCGTEITNFHSPFCPKCLVRVDKLFPTGRLESSEQHDFLGGGVDKNHIEAARKKFFHNNESLIAAYAGSDPGFGVFTQYLLLTNLRVIFWKRGFIEANQTFSYDDIGSVEEYHAILVNGVVLNIKGAKEVFPYMNGNELSSAIKIIREMIQKSKEHPQVTSPVESIPDQIKKLAGLRDSGILTESEFQTKKIELLKRL